MIWIHRNLVHPVLSIKKEIMWGVVLSENGLFTMLSNNP